MERRGHQYISGVRPDVADFALSESADSGCRYPIDKAWLGVHEHRVADKGRGQKCPN